MTDLTRRQLLASAAAAPLAARAAEPAKPFGYCLNVSTIRGQKLTPPQQVEVAATAGYDAIEPWVPELEGWVKKGGSVKDLSKQIADAGLKVPDAIGFAEWIVDDDARRKQGLENARRAMELVREIGCERIAAPPIGAQRPDAPKIDLLRAAERYRALCELGDTFGVVPVVEHWGFSKNLSRLGEALLVASESGHPKACVLPDIYHLYKGGSEFGGVHLLAKAGVGIFHVNDYPGTIGREKITDADRVYPGDGVAPLAAVLRSLRAAGYSGVLSLELFNPEYWKRDALEVARTGLAKMKAVVSAQG